MKQTIKPEILTLLEHQHGPYMSIIVPVHRFSPERSTDEESLEKVIQRAKQYLLSKYPKLETKPLLTAIDELRQQIDNEHKEGGIGLFVAPGFQQLLKFFFPVKEKLMISEMFEIRDVLYQDYYSSPYFVVMLSEKEARLFKAHLNVLDEVHDAVFPVNNDPHYEYSKPVYGSAGGKNSYTKAIEKDRSQLEEIRFESFLKQVDDGLKSHLGLNMPLIVTGAKKDLSYFNKVTRHSEHIAGLVPGNYAHLASGELGHLTWSKMMSYLQAAQQEEIRKLDEEVFAGHCITGIEAIWKAVQEGKGLQLYVEKDLTIPGFMTMDNEYQLLLHPPKGPHRILPDAINNLINIVLKKNGRVALLDNKSLSKFQGMALITRY